MATYQKRGYIKSKENEIETTPETAEVVYEKSTTEEVFTTLDETANLSEKWVEKNSKNLLIAFAVVVGSIFAYLGYHNFISEPNEKEAANALVNAKQNFMTANASQADSLYQVALDGQGGNLGLKDIAADYSSTKAGKLSAYYAGISYLHLGKYSNALEFLSDASSNDPIITALIAGAKGDAYLGMNKTTEAIESYETAYNETDNDAIKPLYMLKAGKVLLSTGNNEKALAIFEEIKDQFPNVNLTDDIDIYINQAKF